MDRLSQPKGLCPSEGWGCERRGGKVRGGFLEKGRLLFLGSARVGVWLLHCEMG